MLLSPIPRVLFHRHNLKNGKKYFLMKIADIFCYRLAFLSYIYNIEVPIQKKPTPGDHEFNLKICR